jgi:hypothetical protein
VQDLLARPSRVSHLIAPSSQEETGAGVHSIVIHLLDPYSITVIIEAPMRFPEFFDAFLRNNYL